MIDASQDIQDSIARIKVTATPRLLMEAARARGWTVSHGQDERLIYLHLPDGRKILLYGINTALNSYLGTVIATSKYLSDMVIKDIAPDLLVPTIKVSDIGPEATEFLRSQGSVVAKPDGGAHGKGIVLNIQSEEHLQTVLEEKFEGGTDTILLQKQVIGNDFRLLVVGDKVVAAVMREPASVTGDGTHTVRELIGLANDVPRQEDFIGTLSSIPLDEAAAYLDDDISRVPTAGEHVQVIAVANISKGGIAIDQTSIIPEGLAKLTVSIAKQVGLGIMAADFLIPGINGNLELDQATLLEINSQPGIRMHHYPTRGTPVNVADLILQELEKH